MQWWMLFSFWLGGAVAQSLRIARDLQGVSIKEYGILPHAMAFTTVVIPRVVVWPYYTVRNLYQSNEEKQ